MPGPDRVTKPLLEVLEVLVEADHADSQVHGWAVMKACGRSGPTVYGVLERLEESGWVRADWEHQNPVPGKPRRRFYSLTSAGVQAAQDLLTARRVGRRPN
jgi:PadR family transcriptional regulator PadR